MYAWIQSCRYSRSIWHALLIIPAGCLTAPPVWAHGAIAGSGSFYSGFVHPLLEPAQLLLIIASGLFCGHRGLQKRPRLLLSPILALSLGFSCSWLNLPPQLSSWLTPLILITAAPTSLLLTLAVRPPLLLCSALLSLAALLLGLDSNHRAASLNDQGLMYLGSALSISLFILYGLALADFCRAHHWTGIAIRIAGSWIAASSLMYLAFVFH